MSFTWMHCLKLHALYKRKYSLCWELFILWLIASLLFKQIRRRQWFPKWGGASPRERCRAVASGKATALWLPRSLSCRLTRGVGRLKMESVCKYVMSQNWNSVFGSKRNLYMWRTFPGWGHKCAGSTVRHFYKHSHLSINNSGVSEAKGKKIIMMELAPYLKVQQLSNFWPNVTHQVIRHNAYRRIAKPTRCQQPVWLMEKQWVAHSYGNISVKKR